MIPWIDVVNKFGFRVSYVKHPGFTFGWCIAFVCGNFHIGIGVNPEYKS